MKPFLALFFLIAFVTQTFSSVFIIADYFINTASYAKNCENKAMPAMHCNGKCQMMKKVQQQQNKDQQNSGRKYENKNEVLSSKSFFPELSIAINISIKTYTDQTNSFVINRPTDIFHPPQPCTST